MSNTKIRYNIYKDNICEVYVSETWDHYSIKEKYGSFSIGAVITHTCKRSLKDRKTNLYIGVT